jgi:hypothetical protein
MNHDIRDRVAMSRTVLRSQQVELAPGIGAIVADHATAALKPSGQTAVATSTDGRESQ